MKVKKRRKLAHNWASHWSGWIAGDSGSEQLPSEEDLLIHSGSPSNRIDNSGTAAPCSLHANKFTIQTWTNVLKQNIRNTHLLLKECDQHWREKFMSVLNGVVFFFLMVLLMCVNNCLIFKINNTFVWVKFYTQNVNWVEVDKVKQYPGHVPSRFQG